MANINLSTNNPSYRHGHKTSDHESPTYRAWKSMLRRCRKNTCKEYKDYGGRGISVCKDWYQFINFLKDMGVKPDGLQLDRKNNNGNYSKDNCRWTTASINARNKRNSIILTWGGQNKSVWDWADIVGINGGTIKRRLSRGWTVEQALTTPLLTIYEVSRRGTEKQWGYVCR